MTAESRSLRKFLRPRRAASGSYPVGLSPDYLALLRGEISSKEYVERLKATVDGRLRG